MLNRSARWQCLLEYSDHLLDVIATAMVGFPNANAADWRVKEKE